MEPAKSQTEHTDDELEALREKAKAVLCGLPLEHRHELLLSVINQK